MKVQAEIGHGGWLLGMMVASGKTGITPGGLSFAAQAYFGDVSGIMGGIEVAYLPLIYGKFDTGSSTFETSVVFITIGANVQLNYGFGFSELDVGYAIFVGEVKTESGTETLDAENPIFINIGTGLIFDISDSIATSININDYIPITSPLAGTAAEDVPALLWMTWSIRAGVQLSF
jgi:hypothetical protein